MVAPNVEPSVRLTPKEKKQKKGAKKEAAKAKGANQPQGTTTILKETEDSEMVSPA